MCKRKRSLSVSMPSRPRRPTPLALKPALAFSTVYNPNQWLIGPIGSTFYNLNLRLVKVRQAFLSCSPLLLWTSPREPESWVSVRLCRLCSTTAYSARPDRVQFRPIFPFNGSCRAAQGGVMLSRTGLQSHHFSRSPPLDPRRPSASPWVRKPRFGVAAA